MQLHSGFDHIQDNTALVFADYGCNCSLLLHMHWTTTQQLDAKAIHFPTPCFRASISGTMEEGQFARFPEAQLGHVWMLFDLSLRLHAWCMCSRWPVLSCMASYGAKTLKPTTCFGMAPWAQDIINKICSMHSSSIVDVGGSISCMREPAYKAIPPSPLSQSRQEGTSTAEAQGH